MVASPWLWLMTKMAPKGALPMNCLTVAGGRHRPGPPRWRSLPSALSRQAAESNRTPESLLRRMGSLEAEQLLPAPSLLPPHRPEWWFNFPTTKPLGFANFEADRMSDAESVNTMFAPLLNLGDLAWLRENWPGKLIRKGIESAADAVDVLARGADTLVVSNHGGPADEGVLNVELAGDGHDKPRGFGAGGLRDRDHSLTGGCSGGLPRGPFAVGAASDDFFTASPDMAHSLASHSRRDVGRRGISARLLITRPIRNELGAGCVGATQ